MGLERISNQPLRTRTYHKVGDRQKSSFLQAPFLILGGLQLFTIKKSNDATVL
jgi:hypothetical protein